MLSLYKKNDLVLSDRYILRNILLFCAILFILFNFSFLHQATNTASAQVSCATNTGDCDNDALTGVGGCETDLLSDKNNCGYCGEKCNGVCANGTCDKITGGIVPCGRVSDNCVTPVDETQACDLCHVFLMFQIISTYIFEISAIVAAFFILLGGFIYATSGGEHSRIEQGKRAVKWAIGGLVIVILAWTAVTVVLTAFGYVNPFGGNWNEINCNVPTATATCICGDGILDAELGEKCDGTSGVAHSPTESSPTKQYGCTASCTPAGGYAGDGIVNGDEPCDANDPANPVNPCTTLFTTGLPAYCTGVPVAGTQTCNSTSTDWDVCVAGTPSLSANNYGSCSSATIYVSGYSCCELTGCQADACCAGLNSGDSTVPGGYTQRGILNYSGGNCKLSQSDTVNTDWAISINHTTGGYQCWD